VREKLEREVIHLEENLRNSLIEQFPKLGSDAELKAWLRNIESENPAFKHTFLIHADGGLISTSISFGWKKSRKSQPLINPQKASDLRTAEKAEFIRKDFVDAIGLYRKVSIYAPSPQERAHLLSRIGRCYFKMGKYREGIREYKKILKFEDEEVTIGAVPASIVALSQMGDGYAALNASRERYNIILQIYQRLLDHPWDLLGGEYLYYLKSTSVEIRRLGASSLNTNLTGKNIEELMNRGKKLLEQIRFIEIINQNILAKIESNLNHITSSELQPQHISFRENNSTHQIGYFKLPSAFQKSKLFALGYQIEKDDILSNVFPEVLASVELGRDVFMGVLDEKESVLYPRHNRPISNYLVAENFSQLFSNWKVALFDRDGKSIEQLVGRERRLYLSLFVGINSEIRSVYLCPSCRRRRTQADHEWGEACLSLLVTGRPEDRLLR